MYLSNILTLFFCMKTNRNHDINNKSVLTFRHSKKKKSYKLCHFPNVAQVNDVALGPLVSLVRGLHSQYNHAFRYL